MSEALRAALMLQQMGRLSEAESALLVLARQGDAQAMHMLALVLMQLQRPAEALTWVEQAATRLPPDARLAANRSAILMALGRHRAAAESARTGLRVAPQHRGCLLNLARAHSHLGELPEAIATLSSLRDSEDSEAVRGEQAELYLKLARQTTDLLAAKAAYEQFRALGGRSALASLEHANVLQNIGAAELALPFYAEAMQQRPEDADVASAWLIARNFDPVETADSLGQAARAVAVRYQESKPGPATPIPSARNPRCIGLYSPRFCDGPMASLIQPLLSSLRAHADRIVLFSGFDHGASAQASFRQVADCLVDVSALDDAAFAAAVAAESVGILIDLCGHAPGNRLRAFEKRLAPVQVSYGDWFMSTGLANMDLFLSDAVLSPEIEDSAYTETVLRLPNTRFAYQPPDGHPAPATDAPVRIRFASFNRLSKLTETCVSTWAKLLRAVPDADLYLRSGGLEQPSLLAAVRARFARLGIDPARIQGRGFTTHLELLRDYQEVTLALDPFPFNGCVTTLDALWMATPVLTLHGQSVVARQGASLLHAHGFPELVASSVDDYVDRARRLVDRDEQQRLRARLLACRATSPLFRPAALADDIAAALTAWQATRVNHH